MINVKVKYHTRVIAKDGTIKSEQRGRNLVLNYGLNAMAKGPGSCKPAEASLYCQVGIDGADNWDALAGTFDGDEGEDTFSATNSVFAADDVGKTIKFGTDETGPQGVIESYTSPTQVTLERPLTATFANQPARLWRTERTQLPGKAYESNTYRTDPGDCGTTISAEEVSFKRTYIFDNGEEYTVRELGWASLSGDESFGRAVLDTPDVVGTTDTYIVTLELIFNYAPVTVTVHDNVSTSMNDSGFAMIEHWSMSRVNSDGTVTSTDGGCLDSGASVFYKFGSSYLQQDVPTSGPTSEVVWSIEEDLITDGVVSWAYANRTGEMSLTFPVGTINTNLDPGATFYGVGFGKEDAGEGFVCFDVKFETPLSFSGAFNFNPRAVFNIRYDQVLDNSWTN